MNKCEFGQSDQTGGSCGEIMDKKWRITAY